MSLYPETMDSKTLNSKDTILVSGAFSLTALNRLRAHSGSQLFLSETNPVTSVKFQYATAWIIRSGTRVTPDILEKMPGLRVIVTATSGFDHIDLESTRSRSITVMHTPEANVASAAELTWALVLACVRNIPRSDRKVRQGEWRSQDLRGSELRGKTYGIIGLGRVGSRVAKIARAFDMEVIAFDPYAEANAFAGLQRLGLDEVLGRSDVISLHVPLTRETRHLINQKTLRLTNPGAVIVNTSRGSVVSENDVLQALESGSVAALGLDVFEKEPPTQHSALLRHPRTVFSPHIGAFTLEAFERSCQHAADQVLEYLQDVKNVTHPLPPSALWYSESL